ncbi:hypothetical protein OPS25_03695 [Alteromonas ponticola]|uniref:Long-chain-fatty-acyl-CoA reductase n=1 Tax=Alteromonas aquimaris TaxID=2998417 RepID=A0ABT3P4C6_9ALTE|nr:acyl-CoA reductase [Alteromonas aquimaris]MCW8107608.1 hypothetical protein [Alteromonas aquimaris]
MSSNLIKQLNEITDLGSLDIFSEKSLTPYDPLIISFTSALSKQLMAPESQHISELVALGFWLRENNIIKEFQHQFTCIRKPVGMVVHYTPANVDTMFVYSWICSLVCGNRNLIRLNSRLSELQNVLLNCISSVLAKPEFEAVAKTNAFIQYDKSLNELAIKISRSADARVLWGGDASVMAIRQLPIKPRCRDISFSDRYSASILNGDELSAENIKDVAEHLYRDIHPFNQQACSSPKIIFWKGSATLQPEVLNFLDKKFSTNMSVTLKNEQLVMLQSMAVEGEIRQAFTHNSLLSIEIQSGASIDVTRHNGQFSIWIVPIRRISELNDYCDDKLQTLTYWGINKEELVKFLSSTSIHGIDRLVPLGQALSFSSQWDGYSLVDQLTKIVSVE